MYKYKILFLSIIFLSLYETSQADANKSDCAESNTSFHDVLPRYIKQLAKQPLNYKLLNKEAINDLEVRHYLLDSQIWSPGGLVKPSNWQHNVDIYLPKNPVLRHAVLFINNGTRYVSSGKPFKTTDMSNDALSELANNTNSIVISISDIPNQNLVYENDNIERREDANVARSWTLFMNDPKKLSLMPLHVPMAAAASQAMSLAENELKQWKINKFIVSGMSKRGWATWLSAIADTRVEGIVPFVIDVLGVKEVLTHMYKVYGNNWSIAFAPYIKENIDNRISTSEFTKLMEISDPLKYLNTKYKNRLSIPKYIVNASGDDFFVPDNTHFFYDKLSGEKTLWTVPNVDHNGIKEYSVNPLTSFVKRIQQNKKLPKVDSTFKSGQLNVNFSEQPKSVKLWTAVNSTARDFRYACNIRYSEKLLAAKKKISVALAKPKLGWTANYIEAVFSDGYTVSSQVYISPDDKYPVTAPKSDGGGCQTIPASTSVIKN